MKSYRKVVEPLLKDEHQAQWKKVPEQGYNANPFSDGKIFDLDHIYNNQSDRIWAVNREETNRRGGKKLSQKVMIWLEDIASLRLFEKVTLDHYRYVEEVLPCCSTITETVNLETTGPSSKTKKQHICDVAQIFHQWPANSPNLNPAFGMNSFRPSTGIQ